MFKPKTWNCKYKWQLIWWYSQQKPQWKVSHWSIKKLKAVKSRLEKEFYESKYSQV